MTDGHYYEVQVSTVFSTLELSTAIDVSCKVVAVRDAGFSKKMRFYGTEEEDSNCLRKDCTKLPKNCKESKGSRHWSERRSRVLIVKSHASVLLELLKSWSRAFQRKKETVEKKVAEAAATQRLSQKRSSARQKEGATETKSATPAAKTKES